MCLAGIVVRINVHDRDDVYKSCVSKSVPTEADLIFLGVPRFRKTLVPGNSAEFMCTVRVTDDNTSYVDVNFFRMEGTDRLYQTKGKYNITTEKYHVMTMKVTVAVLHIYNLTVRDSGVYKCLVNTTVSGSISAFALLEVEGQFILNTALGC